MVVHVHAFVVAYVRAARVHPLLHEGGRAAHKALSDLTGCPNTFAAGIALAKRLGIDSADLHTYATQPLDFGTAVALVKRKSREAQAAA